MGFHACEYLSREEAEQLNLRNLKVFYSSGDVTICFDSGRSWRMPDMAPLYVELGWVPPQKFIDDIMNAKITASQREQTFGVDTVEPVGYINPKDNPLPRPFKVSDKLPAGFLDKLSACMEEAANFGFNRDRSGRSVTNSGRMQTKGFKPGQ